MSAELSLPLMAPEFRSVWREGHLNTRTERQRGKKREPQRERSRWTMGTLTGGWLDGFTEAPRGPLGGPWSSHVCGSQQICRGCGCSCVLT